jgi:hypothetical protein
VDLAADVPFCLFQILERVTLQIRAPDVFDRVAQAEPHVFRDLDALNRRWMAGVVRRVIDHVSY